MRTLDDFVTEISQDCAEEYRRRLRARPIQQPREWLVEQLLEHMADFPAPASSDGADAAAEPEGERVARQHRIRAMEIDERYLASFSETCQSLDRDALEARGYLIAPPPKGSTSIDAEHRTRKGNALLREAKDLLCALLFGDREVGVQFDRVHRELVTITVPHAKRAPLACLLDAATVIEAEGTWHDPEHVADDDRSRNTLVQVEYGEIANEAVGQGIKLALRVINDLEINERVLYARMENVEESTLV